MSKFNQQVPKAPVQQAVTNANGGVGYAMTAKAKLMTQVMTCFFGEKKFYGENNKEIVLAIREMLNIDPKFVANLGIYTREVLNLRSVTHVIAAELAHHPKGKPFAHEAIANIVKRPDDMTEILAYYLNVFTNRTPNPSPFGARPPKGYGDKIPKHVNKAIPNSLKKGLGTAFKRFSAHALQKYNGGARQQNEVKLKDVYFICRPSPNSQEQYEMWQQLINDTLPTPITWETQVSLRGNTREVWEELIHNNAIGYMAALRNLRNMITSGARNINVIYDMLSDEKEVLNSKQLPFRFLSAYKMAQQEGWGTSRTIEVLETALKISAQNIKKIPGKTFWASDASGSMTLYPISEKSIIKPADIAVLLMAIGNYISDESITTVFASLFKPFPVSINGGILANTSLFNHANVGAATNGHLPIEYLLEKKIFVDRIVMLSDNVVNHCMRNAQSTLDEYRRVVNPNVWVHAVDLMGAGVQQFKGPRVNYITGWSEKILDFVMLAEQGSGPMIAAVENYRMK